MKSVKSLGDLTRMALEQGASVELPGGRTINSEQAKERVPPKQVAPKAPAPPAPAPAPAPVAQPAQDSSLAKSNEQLASALSHALTMLQQPVATPSPTKWEFKVERDGNGLMTKITATAIGGPVTH